MYAPLTLGSSHCLCSCVVNRSVYAGIFFFPLALQPNSGLGRHHENFRFTTVTRSRTVGRTPRTDDRLVASYIYYYVLINILVLCVILFVFNINSALIITFVKQCHTGIIVQGICK
jgi:hypothetical protein